MSTRERWIVYPLLFLTLGIALRDKVVPPSHLGMRFEAGELVAPQIRCTELQARRLLVNGSNGQPVVIVGADANTQAGTVETFRADGTSLVRLMSNEIGGMVATIGRGGKLALIQGDTGQNCGIFAELPESGQLVPLTLTLPPENKPPVPPPAQKPTPGQKPVPAQKLTPAQKPGAKPPPKAPSSEKKAGS